LEATWVFLDNDWRFVFLCQVIKRRAFYGLFAFGEREPRVLRETYFSSKSRGCSFFSFSLVDMFGSYACFLIRYSTTGFFKTQFLLFAKRITTPQSPQGGVGCWRDSAPPLNTPYRRRRARETRKHPFLFPNRGQRKRVNTLYQQVVHN
jgi:hypothetical protein